MPIHRALSRAIALGSLATFSIVSAAGLSLADESAPPSPQTVTVGVDHADPANQQPQKGRVFEYTDFFSRDVTIHSGDTIDFQVAPGAFHIVALAESETKARAVYPVGYTDKDDPNGPNGAPKLVNGPGGFPVLGGSTSGGGTIVTDPNAPPPCGYVALGLAPCGFSGPKDIEINQMVGFGQTGPAQNDVKWNVTAPEGDYTMFCTIHPGMRGTIHVVGADESTTTQAEIDAASARQFARDRKAALAAEADANEVRYRGDEPGSRTYQVLMGVAAANNHVAIDEILPTAPLNLVAGDRVAYRWVDPHNVHSVVFPAPPPGQNDTVPPFVFDCGTTISNAPSPSCTEPGETWENRGGIFDPGTAPSRTALQTPTTFLDSGVLVGTGYNVKPTIQSWSVKVNDATAAGTYTYHCSVHDFMQAQFTVTSTATD
jgi:plastocyanin